MVKQQKWTEDDILSFINNKVRESINLDYKSCDALAKTDRKRIEISKDVSAFANSAGGTIIYGVTENRDTHEPETIDVGYDPRDISDEWLEQVINSNIQRRIPEITISTVTLTITRPNRVLYVVDIPESNLAPHMAADHRYYKRYNFESVPMEEYEVRYLVRQETYPSREIVCAWRDDAINPLLNTVTNEQKYLEQKKWTWDRWNKIRNGIGLKELHYISDRRAYSANQEQFLESYPEIQEAMDEHDRAVKVVDDRCEELVSAIKESNYLLDVYLKATTSESLQALIAAYPNELGSYRTDEDVLQRIFGSTEREQHLTILAEYIVNELDEFQSGRTTLPIWNTYRDKFLVAFKYPPISNYWTKADAAREELLRSLEALIGLLKKMRSDLTKQHGVPVEVRNETPIMPYRISDLL